MNGIGNQVEGTFCIVLFEAGLANVAKMSIHWPLLKTQQVFRKLEFRLPGILLRHAKFGLLPNQQSDADLLSSYNSSPSDASSPLKKFMEKHRNFREGLLIVVLFGACMVIGDGVLTPAVSVLASVSGLKVKKATQELLFWPVFVTAILAAIVGSQAVITATFSIIKQCHAFGCFPRVKVVHTSNHVCGQIYIPEANWILMILTLASTIGFQDTTLIGNAYGFVFVTVTFVTTFLMALVIVFVWKKSILLATLFLLFFWAIEGLYLSAVLMKVPQGGWVPLGLSCFFLIVMYVWHYGSAQKYRFDLENKASLKWVLGLGPTLGIVRVPGIGLIYSELATGVPAIFSHFVTNLPAFHKVLVFVCVKSLPVPHVSPKERFHIVRVCPRPYRMYRCVVRYGYKDNQRNDGDFENHLTQSIVQFILTEAMELQFTSCVNSSHDGEITTLSGSSSPSSVSILSLEHEDEGLENTYTRRRSITQQSLQSVDDDGDIKFRKSPAKFGIPYNPSMDPVVMEELAELIEAKESGVTYIMGHTDVQARSSSSFLKKLVIDFGYSFLRRNCRGPAVALNIPHVSLIEVGMIYYV
ncbi:potassium transporter 4 [Senna tora]|uniref:Potassium transporter 4 n=1 Tax=Senna tora TaxID=362788 RepID=A0A834TDM9_9FABA|nr:potassium transporter 4 [Senna tora]